MDRLLKDCPSFISIKEVSVLLGVNERTIRRLIDAGKLQSVKVGKAIRIPKENLIKYLEGGRTDG